MLEKTVALSRLCHWLKLRDDEIIKLISSKLDQYNRSKQGNNINYFLEYIFDQKQKSEKQVLNQVKSWLNTR